ncbi:hypothetical protein [Enterobacter hormaechei]|uniref:hypothetical protein n=1 Tax=Enterobacter hormaechei TaxID=158836 RepID=UPI0018C2D6F3|nr:hypothetical protein [Enterobacter hormaechei]MBF9796139.1 hypothetical protein [Enterobacter hormaechei]
MIKTTADIDLLRKKIQEYYKDYLKKNAITKTFISFDKMKICKDFTLENENHDFCMALIADDNKLTIADLKESLLLLECELIK